MHEKGRVPATAISGTPRLWTLCCGPGDRFGVILKSPIWTFW